MCLVLPQAAKAQAQGKVKLGAARMKIHPSGSPVDLHSPKKSADGTPVKRSEFAAAPIPIINPTIGNGLAGVGMVAVHLNPEDTVSPPSVVGAGGMYTSSKSWALAAGAEFFLKEDRFRIIFAVGDGRFNYKFYGTGHESGAAGNALPISQSAFGYMIEPKVRVFERVYVGPRYRFARSQVSVDRNSDLLPDIDPDDPSVPVIPPPDEEADVAALGLRVERDTRDSQFYPRVGSFIDGKFDFYDPAVGGDRTYQTYEIAYQGYRAIGSKNVIAYRAAACAVDGDVPFYNLCLLGQSKDIRGYGVGRYQDRRMIVGQVEFRRELAHRFGLVAFFGLGEVAETLSDFNTANILPGGGIGLRWDVAPENHINLRVDYAWGRDSTALYIGIMEVF